MLIRAAVPQTTRVAKRRVDFVGAGLCALGLGGIVFALIEQPNHGWSSPVIFVPLVGGVVAFASFLAYERRAAEPMLKLELFARRNFAVGNAETLAHVRRASRSSSSSSSSTSSRSPATARSRAGLRSCP